ncbi:hypothetical protein J6590_019811 [Homalodisca vitripennis]|nr:hypothetical protein J6590_019811 [Homalodisca vitripennis]
MKRRVVCIAALCILLSCDCSGVSIALLVACSAVVFLSELVLEETFRLLSKHFVAVLAVVSALRESLDSAKLLLHGPATNF